MNTCSGWAKMDNSLTKKELATIAGYTYRRLHQIDQELPEDAKLFVPCKDGKYSLPLFVQRWVDYNVTHEVGDESELDRERARHEVAKREKTEIQVSILKGELIETAAVSRLWADVAATVAGRFVNLARKVAPSLVMMGSADNIEEIIDREVRDALTMLAETPLPSDEMQTPEERTEEE